MREIRKIKVKDCGENSQSLLTCSFSKIAEAYMTLSESFPPCNQMKVCKIPQVETLLEKNGHNLEFCNLTSLAQYQCMYNLAIGARLTDKKKECQKPCDAISYEVTPASVKQPQNIATLMFQFASNEVEVHEELFIYDASSIIASVGGLLGLFVGISFLDILWGIVQYLYTSVKV